MNTTTEKTAMTNAEANKLLRYLAYGTVAAGSVAALNAAVSDKTSKAKRIKALDAERNKNAIVVNIRKDEFLKDLPTPEAQAQMTSSAGKDSAGASSTLTPEEIAAKKKSVMRGNSRKIDFFAKAASKQNVQTSDNADNDNSEPKKTEGGEDGGKKEQKKQKELPRDFAGRFVSPTSPLGVIQSEKAAGASWWDKAVNFVRHPVDTAEAVGKDAVGGAFKDAPMVIGGGLAALYLSAKIVEAINENRARKSQWDADSARERYLKLLQPANEKAAQADDAGVSRWAGRLTGASFWVPFALATMISNRIMESRRADREAAKNRTNSYPEEPIILYKTSEDKVLELSPEAALATIMMKTAMIRHVEHMEKRSQVFKRWGQAIGGAIQQGVDAAENAMYDKAVNGVIGALGDQSNSGLALDIAKAYDAQDTDALENHFKTLAGKSGLATWAAGAYNKDELMRRVAADPRTTHILSSYVNDDSNDAWRTYREGKVNDYFNQYFGNTFVKGGWLERVVKWLMNNLGIGKYMANRFISNKLGQIAKPQAAAQATPAATAAPAQA